GRDQVECCTNCTLGVVLGRRGGAPNRHHRVTDELLDRSPVHLDDTAGEVEVAREELPDLFGVPGLGERCEAYEVGEQNRDEATLGHRCVAGEAWGRRGRASERCTAVATEPLVGRVLGAARAAGERQRRAAVAAEALAGSVLATAVRARDHTASLTRRGPYSP